MKQMLLVAVLATVALAGCTSTDENPEVRFETSLGAFTVELWPDVAPVTVENFLRYVDEGHYTDLTFHRIAPDFVVQGGGFLADHQTLRETNPPIVNEARADVPNDKWTLSMARTTAPDSATSQFFINLKDNAALDKSGGSAGYAVFGKVISGFDTVEAMTKVEAGQSFGAGGFYPKQPIVIQKATIIKGEAPGALPPPTPADIEANVITPGTWHVTMADDAIFAWARNHGESSADLTWTLTGPAGTPLPEGWTISFDDPQTSIGGVGGSNDHVSTMIRVQVPSTASGEFDLELHTGLSTTPVTVNVDMIHDRVSKEGDSIVAGYRGTCVQDDKEFDAGEFPLTLGGGRAIKGFDLGLVGLGLGETATLVIPHGHAYGANGGPCGGMDNADLRFEVEVKSFEN